MKVRILGQDNPQAARVASTTSSSIEELLRQFLNQYKMTPQWKNQPLLLVLDEPEESSILANDLYRGLNENTWGYKLRMLSEVATRFNESKGLVGGFSATFVTGVDNIGDERKRKMAFTYIEFPPHTALQGENILPPEEVPFYTILGRIVPPSA